MKSGIATIRTAEGARTWRTVLRICAVGAAIFGSITAVEAATAAGTLTILALLISTMVFSAAAIYSNHLALLCGQRARDLTAQSILEGLRRRAAHVPKFTLYLRPFASTDVFDATEIPLMPAFVPRGVGAAGGAFMLPPERFELEEQIARAIRPVGPLVALGAPLEHIGAGRILVGDHEWQDAIALLLQAAELIVLLPSSREGTLWEIGKVLTGDVIARTVVIDPPNGSVSGMTYDHANEWRAVREAFAARGYQLPADNAAGQLIFFGPEREPIRIHRFDITSPGRLRRFFQSAVRASTLGVLDRDDSDDDVGTSSYPALRAEPASGAGRVRGEMLQTEKDENMRTWSAQIATWVGIISAMTGGFFTIEAYRDEVAKKVDERVVGTFERIEKFNEVEFRNIRDKIAAEAFARRICDVRAQARDLSLNEAYAFVDFYDVVALCADADLCEPKLTEDYFGPYADSVWLTIKPFIEHVRNKEKARGTEQPRFGYGLQTFATNPTPLKESCEANFFGVLARFEGR